MALVAEHGPLSVTMSQIAEKTGIGRASHAISAAASMPSKAAVLRLVQVALAGVRPDRSPREGGIRKRRRRAPAWRPDAWCACEARPAPGGNGTGDA